MVTYQPGQTVRYSKPEDAIEAGMTFTLLEDNGDRVLIRLNDPTLFIQPVQTVKKDEVEAVAVCPECGSTFTIDPDALKGVTYHPGYHVRGTDLPVRLVPATVAFCNGCEYAIELGGVR